MTPTLSPQQREALREAMARAVCRYDGHNPDELWDIGAHAKFEAPEPAWHSYTDDIDPLVDVLWDAALPAIIGAVWREAAERMERHMDTCDVVALTHPDERTIIEYRIKEDAYRDASEEFRALAEKGTKS